MVILVECSPSSNRWRAGACGPGGFLVFAELLSVVGGLEMELLDKEVLEAHEVRRRRDSRDNLEEREEEEDAKLG